MLRLGTARTDYQPLKELSLFPTLIHRMEPVQKTLEPHPQIGTETHMSVSQVQQTQKQLFILNMMLVFGCDRGLAAEVWR